MMKNILFICTGNTCRSCMAEGILKSFIEKDSQLNMNFSSSSAGIHAYEGDCASEHARKVLADEWGIDLSPHRSKLADLQSLNDAYLILTMTRGHKDALLSALPDLKPKTFTLTEYAYSEDPSNRVPDFSKDISDPFGMSVDVYRKCAFEIYEAVKRLVNILKGQVT